MSMLCEQKKLSDYLVRYLSYEKQQVPFIY